MTDFLKDVRRLAQATYTKLCVMLKEANPTALQLTGLLGIVAALAGMYHLRNIRRRNRGNADNRPPRDAWSQSRAAAIKPKSAFGVSADSVPVPLGDLRSHLPGIKTVTISAPGVLLEEWDPEKFEEGAFVKPDAAEIVKELAAGMHVYILAHVKSDVGEAVVRAALETSNVLGPGIRQLPPHRLIFCEKLKGKVSLVRQIEPQLHIDGSSETLEELQRFIPHLYQVVRKGGSPAACKTSLVASGPTLADAMNVQVYY